MSGGKYIKQAIISALCEHPEQDKYRQRAFSGENLEKVMEAIATESQKLTKADFLTPDDEGAYIIDTPGFWRNFEKIHDIVQANGDRFRAEDFQKPLGRDDSKTLLASATAEGALGKIFNYEVWKGRFDEMERLWYKAKMPFRKELFKNDGLIDRTLKRRLLADEGRTLPEDRLAAAGITQFDLRSAFAERGNYEEVARRLGQAGDWMRKEYLLLPDSSGDTLFYYQATWDKYDDLVKNMKKNGERMEVADFLRQVGFVLTPLARAAERNALDKVFKAEHWEGRLGDMLQLWSHVLPGWKTGSMTVRDFDRAYADAESLTYAGKIDFKAIAGKGDLIRAINEPAGDVKPVLPLGLKIFWQNFKEIEQDLTRKGQKLATSDLRLQSGQMGDTCLASAIKFGHFADVAAISRKSADPLTLTDYLARDRHGNTLINIIAERNELALAFSPDLWVGRVSDMKALWDHVKVSDQKQIDFAQIEVATKQATLRQQAKGNRFKI